MTTNTQEGCPPDGLDPAPEPRRPGRRHARLRTAAALVLMGALTLGSVQAVQASGTAALPLEILDLMVGVASLALLPVAWARRSLPVALVLAALTLLSPGATPAATSGVLHIARWAPLRTAGIVAAASTVAHAAQALWRPPPFPVGWWLLCDLAVHAALLGWGAYLQARAQLLADLRARARRAEADRERAVDAARSTERNRVAAEMHDALGHRLSLLAATAGAVEYRPDAPAEQLVEAAGRVRVGAADALEDLRRLVRLLRAGSDRLAPPPTLADLSALVDAARSVGTVVALDRPADQQAAAEPSPPVATAVYRVVQEGLTNARRHANGASVRVGVSVGPETVHVTVHDDGTGHDARTIHGVETGTETGTGADATTGTGLIGLRERVELLGGTLVAGSTPTGFTLEARIPLA